MPLYFAFPASVKFGTVQVEALPELVELLDDEELLELEDEELDEDVLDDALELLEEELELDELELGGGGSPPHATSAEERTSGAAQAPQGFVNVFILVTKCI
jgi:hypothetical protein